MVVCGPAAEGTLSFMVLRPTQQIISAARKNGCAYFMVILELSKQRLTCLEHLLCGPHISSLIYEPTVGIVVIARLTQQNFV